MANPKGNPQNLIQNLPPEKQPTPEQRRKNAQKAGKASAKAAQARRTFREELINGLTAMIKDKNGKEVTVQEAGTIVMLQRWVKTGDPRLFEIIRDTIGEKPVDPLNIFEPDGRNDDALSRSLREMAEELESDDL